MDVVEVTPDDEIIYAKRKNRDEYIPFVKMRKQQPSSYVSLALKRLDNGNYELQSAWIGEFESPPFPEKIDATVESMPFWDKHAFVWGTQSVQEYTITMQCPW